MEKKHIIFYKKISSLWYFFATLLGFIIFGLGGIIYTIIIIPFLINYRNNSLKKQIMARYITMMFWKFFVVYLIIFKLIKIDFKNKEKLGKEGQFIIANHPSLLDVLFFVSYVKRLNCIVKKGLLKNPIMIGALLSCGYIIKKDTTEKLIKTCHNVLKNQCLLVFPEGTRTGLDGIIKFNKGTLSIGLRSAKIITPVIIKMDQQIFKKKQPWYKIPKKIINYEFIVCDDITPKDWLDKYPLPIASKKINNYLQNLFQKELSL